ncbi:c-type cytochrome [Stieleria sp. TO1_6]|uniref:cytochrome c n=1 Tax=Stieleria tagensis TaxID=2956795 RepID=UPI00209ACF88|nr:cytochrome c [Stieleria tagensis]MCO8120313.1 c-type cytochrome [Stieleria tagensis]
MRRARFLLPIFALAAFCGCDVPVEQYPANQLHALVVATSRHVPTEVAAQDSAAVVEAWFGTPIRPRWPVDQMSGAAAKQLVDPDHLMRAAGRVYSDQQNRHFGLFNEHCVTCHGVAGGGDGPASLLQNPYPRDFRAGVFKWKSTHRSSKPTRHDLTTILQHGVPGTGMPSFASLSTEDLQALVDYVIYLSVRGEFERGLISQAVDTLGYEIERPDPEASLTTLLDPTGDSPAESSDAMQVARQLLDQICGEWVDATAEVIEVPAETPDDAESVRRGRELFHGQIANCVGCHGPGGNAEVATLDYDDWTKEFTTRLAITPSDREAVKPFRQAGALRPRQIHPRKLSDGVYRGGGDGDTLYRRIVGGIAGTPMPSQIIAQQATATGLSQAQVWDLVHYLHSLSGVHSLSEDQVEQ